VDLQDPNERLIATLRRLAADAAELFDELLLSGAELPFEIEPTEGDGPLPMYQYVPRTGEFIRRHTAELRRLPSFVEVRELAGEETAIGFLVGLWDGRGEFDLPEDRVRGAIDGVLATLSPSGTDSPAGELIVPLIGFHMPGDEIELDGVQIVRADRIEDAPPEAIEATRPGRRGRPGFLACVRCAAPPLAPAAAVTDDLRRALRTMRLFKRGAVGIGAHGWARHAGGWQRFSTGAPRPRHGGYRLTGAEAGDLESFARILAERGPRLPALAWALSRFDLGAERDSQVEALSDYLLAIRGLLEGGGPARASLGARLAALCEGDAGRDSARICVERALALERKLMSGARFGPSLEGSPLEVIEGLEDMLRHILRGMATGELGGDLRLTADEILLADGLRVGEVAPEQPSETAEWSLPEIPDAEIEIRATREGDDRDVPAQGTEDSIEGEGVPDPSERETTGMIAPKRELQSSMAVERNPFHSAGEERARDWFAATGGEPEWPAFANPRRENRARRGEAIERVRHLFPVPETTDWDVGELRYERNRS